MKAIGLELSVSIDAVCYFMRKHRLKRRDGSESSALLFSRKPLSYKIKNNLSASDLELKTAGIMLYWAEGYKTTKSNGIDFANSDQGMIVVFVSFLRKICGIDAKRLRVLLYCYSNQDTNKLIAFWSKLAKIPISQFTKPYVRTDFRLDKKNKMKMGMVHIRYSDKKLWLQVMQWIKEYQQKLLRVGGGVVNRTAL
ncbi:MAG: hypothetical protein Q8Q92_04170 [bacterium]|nr:hypothetical protein [bacterium]